MREKVVVILTLGMLFLSLGASAQEITASLTGTVTDPTGAVIPGAKIVVHDIERNVDVRIVNTDRTGVYTASVLSAGTYTVTISAKGFQDYVAKELILHVGDNRTLNVTLQPGEVTQSITVTSTATPVQTESASQSATIIGTQIRELQLNNRNFEQLVTLQPGVSSSLPDQVSFGITNTDAISVNGARTGANNWTVDGSDVNDSGSNLTLLNVPSVDALQEFTLERGTYDAQYGRSGGGQVNVVTKAGTSQFHGDAYEFFRNNVLDANSFFLNSAGASTPPFRYNDFGYTFGGPFYIPGHYNTNKNKTFFFWSEEWRRIRQPSTNIATLPDPQWLNGFFPGTQLNPESAPTGCITNDPVNNNAQISPSCFSQNAKAYIGNVYSKFTPNGAAGTFEYITPLSAINDYRQELIRVDQNVTDKVHLFGRYIQDSVPTTEPGGLFAGEPLPGISSTSTNAPGRNIVAHVTMELTPNIVNEAAFNYSWGAINSNITGIITSPSFRSALTNQLPFSDPYGRVPGLTISGVTGVAIPVSPYEERNVDKNVYDNLSMVRGNHSIRTGISVQWMRKSENAVNPTNGTFTFRSADGNTAFANFLLGNAQQFSQSSRDIIPDLHFANIEMYVQDDWKLRPNFTLNLGVRYSILPTPFDTNGILDNFSPATFNPADVPSIDPLTGRFVADTLTPANYINGIIVGGKTSPYGDRVNPNYNHNFAPRFGFAWDPFGTGKTSVRGGYGIYYDRSLNGIWEQNQFQNPPFVSSLTLLNASFDNPTNGSPPASVLAPRQLHATGSPAFKVPYMQQWSLSVQREILPNTLVQVAYVGSKGTHLLGQLDMNQVPVEARLANPSVDANALRPFLGYSTINTIAPLFNSNYNSLQVSANRRVARGLSFGVAYTWSKTLTNNTTDRSSASFDSYNFANDYGPANFSRSQILVMNYVYDLPFFTSQSGLTGKTLGGWELSGINTFESGFPLTIFQFNDPFDSVNPSGIGIDPSPISPRPDLMGNPNGPKTVSEWFNTSAFQASEGHFGSAGRGIVTGPGFNNWDFALLKNVKISERFHTQFRAEFFNLFNHTSFSGVSTTLGSSTFGRVTSTHDPRIIQLGLKLYF